MNALFCIQVFSLLMVLSSVGPMIYGRFRLSNPWFNIGTMMSIGGMLAFYLCRIVQRNADASGLDWFSLILFGVLFSFAVRNWAHRRHAAHLGGDA